MDLGCDVGRVGEHFARAYGGYIGVDITESHLDLTRRRFASLGLTNARAMADPGGGGAGRGEVLPYPRIGPIGFSYMFTARKPR
ncbi:MAG TPA: class I SAM-dependent methyltransferase [Stellaceae bacterium]